ncbi:hypothetical protein GB937_009386 [Aspergillus fischeri]|nr:hypothetical protein GB937_009386 [Aspergillus fischeri]
MKQPATLGVEIPYMILVAENYRINKLERSGSGWAQSSCTIARDHCSPSARWIRSSASYDGPKWSIEDILFTHADVSQVSNAEFSQPLSIAVHIAMSFVDEMAAAYAAGPISAEDAIVAAYYRGQVAKDVNTDDALATLQSRLGVAGVFTGAVKANGKVHHSHHMAPAADRYLALMREAKQHHRGRGAALAMSARMASSVTNTVLPEGTLLEADYWSQNLRCPSKDFAVRLLEVAWELFLQSYKQGFGHGRVELHAPLWAETHSSLEQHRSQFPCHYVLGLAEPTWRNVLRGRDQPRLNVHHLGGKSIFPAVGYFVMAIKVMWQLNELSDDIVEIESYVLRDVSIKTALVTADDDNQIEVLGFLLFACEQQPFRQPMA